MQACRAARPHPCQWPVVKAGCKETRSPGTASASVVALPPHNPTTHQFSTTPRKLTSSYNPRHLVNSYRIFRSLKLRNIFCTMSVDHKFSASQVCTRIRHPRTEVTVLIPLHTKRTEHPFPCHDRPVCRLQIFVLSSTHSIRMGVGIFLQKK